MGSQVNTTGEIKHGICASMGISFVNTVHIINIKMSMLFPLFITGHFAFLHIQILGTYCKTWYI